MDDEAGRNSIFGGLSASGWYTASLWMRRWVDTVLTDSTSQGSPGGRGPTGLAPVFPGDTLTFAAEVLSARLSKSRPDLGLVGFERHGAPWGRAGLPVRGDGMFTARG